MNGKFWLGVVALAALAVGGCGSTDEAAEQGSASDELSSDQPVSVAPEAPPKLPLPEIAVSCNNPDTGNEILQMVTEPSSGKIYVHNVVDEVNENRYSQTADSYEINGEILSFFARYAKKDDPNRIEYDISNGAWSEENGYNPQKRRQAEECEAREQAERADCAEAANIDACVATRYPGLKGMCYSGANLSTMIERNCTPLADHNQALDAAKRAWANSVDYWKNNN